MSSSTAPFQDALALLNGAGTWYELRDSLKERGLDSHLSAAEKQDLLSAWHAREARGLTEAKLADELAFWAGGGTFDKHLDGWQAVSPRALVDEAKRRGWFVRSLASGAVVNPPEGRPLVLSSLASPRPIT